MNFEIKRQKELLKRRKRLIKLLITIILFLVFIMIILKTKTENGIVNQIGMNLSTYYSKKNFEYKKFRVDDINEYIIVKRLNNKVYYERQDKVNRNYVKKIYYFDLNSEQKWRILEDEKIIITDDYIDYVPKTIGNLYLNVGNTYSENYCLFSAIQRKKDDKILSLKSVKDKKIDGTIFYEICLKITSGIEKTYFDKESFLPVKSIMKTEKNGDIEYKIDVIFDTVIEDYFKIINEYKKLTSADYSEYKRVMGY